MGTAADPRSLKAPVVTYVPITKVEGFSEFGFPPVPTLEPNLTSFFRVKPADTAAGRCPVLATARDQVLARFVDRRHQCAFQASAASNKVALLAHSLTDLAS